MPEDNTSKLQNVVAPFFWLAALLRALKVTGAAAIMEHCRASHAMVMATVSTSVTRRLLISMGSTPCLPHFFQLHRSFCLWHCLFDQSKPMVSQLGKFVVLGPCLCFVSCQTLSATRLMSQFQRSWSPTSKHGKRVPQDQGRSRTCSLGETQPLHASSLYKHHDYPWLRSKSFSQAKLVTHSSNI